MKKCSFWIPFAVAFIVGSLGIKYYLDLSRNDRVRNELIEGFVLAAQALNADLPVRVDENTVLTRAEADGVRFLYFYTVNDVEKRSELIEAFRSIVQNSVCDSVKIVRAMDSGGSFIYTYSFENGELIGSIELTKTDCSTAI